MFRWGERTYVMGIVNCSPDSFSGDGMASAGAAIDHALRLVDEGANVLDIGGESTRPGAEPVEEEEERRRVLPVIEAVARRAGVTLSVDTSKASVAEAALDAGAGIVNDVRALLGDPRMAEVVAGRGATVILMDNRLAPMTGAAVGTASGGGGPGGDQWGDGAETGQGGYPSRVSVEADIVMVVAEALAERVRAAMGAGIAGERIIVDPGIGFGKTPAQSLALLRRLGELRRHPVLAGRPLLVGTSRKGFIGQTLGLSVEERLEGTLATLALAVAQGADLVRVHDVRAAVRCCRMADAIVRG